MKKNLLMIMLLVLCVSPISSQCSIFTVSDGEKILVGNNEDYGPAKKRIWINPPEQGKYGTIMFGFDEGFNNYEGGVNDQGLFIDGAALRGTGWVSDPNKDSIGIEVLFETILGKCKNFEDVEQLANNFNILSLERAQFLITDRNGKSGVLIYHDKKQRLMKMEGSFQIATNFHYGDGPDPYMPNRRYTIGTKMLEDSKNHSIDGFKKILFAIHQDGRDGNPTSYSNIYDLKNNKIYTYNFYNFSEPYIIDMNKIFDEGRKVIKFSDIFESHSYLSEIHYLAKLNEHLVLLIKEKGVRDVLSNLNKMEEYSMIGSLSGVDYANLGYTLIKEKMFSEAIEVFSYNMEKFPKNSGDNYANIAKAYLINKDTTNAIRNYKIASELNPIYEWAIDGLNTKINPIKIDKIILKTYVGNYGPRNVFIEEGELFYQRENGPKYKMTPINENYFYFDEIEYFRLKFIRKNSVVIGVEGHYEDGFVDRNLRTNK